MALHPERKRIKYFIASSYFIFSGVVIMICVISFFIWNLCNVFGENQSSLVVGIYAYIVLFILAPINTAILYYLYVSRVTNRLFISRRTIFIESLCYGIMLFLSLTFLDIVKVSDVWFEIVLYFIPFVIILFSFFILAMLKSFVHRNINKYLKILSILLIAVALFGIFCIALKTQSGSQPQNVSFEKGEIVDSAFIAEFDGIMAKHRYSNDSIFYIDVINREYGCHNYRLLMCWQARATPFLEKFRDYLCVRYKDKYLLFSQTAIGKVIKKDRGRACPWLFHRIAFIASIPYDTYIYNHATVPMFRHKLT